MALFETIYRFFGWWIINIDIFFLTLLLLGSGLLLITKKKWGKGLIVASCVGFAFFGVVPIGLWTLENLENRFPKIEHIPSDTKGMILLGGSFDVWATLARGETAYNLTAGNLIKFVEVAKAYPHLKLIYTGTPFEAETAKKEFQALGIDPASVVFESDSKNTKENASKTADLIKPNSNDKWLLVTSAYHMPRSVALFQKQGFNLIPYPVDYHTSGHYEMWFFLGLKMNLDAWHASSREWLGMVINYIMGRSDEIYPKPKETLASSE